MKKREISERKAELIRIACHRAGLDGHIKWIKYKKDLISPVEMIAATHNALPLPIKRSCMYCDSLDMCFFYTDRNEASVAYSGRATLKRDMGEDEKLIAAFRKAREVLKIMQELIDNEEVKGSDLHRS